MGRAYSSRVDSLSFSGCKNVLMTLLAILFTMPYSGDAQFHQLLPTNDHKEIIPRHPEQIMSGRERKLTCDTDSCNKKQFVWEYLPCGKDYFSNCHNINHENQEWKRLSENIRNKNCSSTLSVITKSSNESGLYRCLLIDKNDFTYKLIKVHHIVVIEKVQINHSSIPNVLELQPTNITIYENMRIVIQCKVYSLLPVEIRWFKEDQNGFIYENKSYIMLNSSQHVHTENNIYLSKLIIEKADEDDSGVYTCAALNSLGPVLRYAHVNVVNPPLMKEYHESTSFSLLFLIPLGLALIPSVVWLCYYRKKKKSERRRNKNGDFIENKNCKYYVV